MKDLRVIRELKVNKNHKGLLALMEPMALKDHRVRLGDLLMPACDTSLGSP
jgi:hypothetical protein